jgi:acyl carrier protein
MNTLLEAKQILSGCLFIPVERIGDDDTIQSIQQMDSLSFAAVLTELEAHVGREIDAEELVGLRTVRDLSGLLEQNR